MLTKKSYQIIKTVQNTIERYDMFNGVTHVIVGVSGGIDSVCLLSILRYLAPNYGIHLMAAHINHGLRGEEAIRDERFVQELCKDWKIPIEVLRSDVKRIAQEEHMTVEQAGRKVRYQYFDELCREYPIARIATAHHKNDQTETVIMHLMRGSGLSGLCGIPYCRENVIRPMLNLSRQDILRYQDLEQLSYCEDSTNQSDAYKRNRVRHDLLPQMEEYNPRLIETVSESTCFLQEDKKYISDQMQYAWQSVHKESSVKQVVFDRRKMAELPFALLSRVVRQAGESIGESPLVSYDMWKQFQKRLSGSSSESFFFSDRLEATFTNQQLLLRIPLIEQPLTYQYVLPKTGEYALPELNMTICLTEGTTQPSQHDSMWVDADKIEWPMTVRERRVGDCFYPAGMAGSKSVKKFLTDCKIDKANKNRIPIFLSGQNIVWVGGIRQDRRFLPTEHTTRFIKIQIKRGQS